MFTFTQWIDLLLKGHGHKYIKRIPYNTPKGRRYRYIYNVTHSHRGKHAMDESHLKEGTKFMVHTESGKEVHAHITSVKGGKVTYVLDDGADKGKEVTASKSEIVSMLNEKHNVNEQVQAKREKLRADIEQARKTGTEKQVARLESQLERLGGEKPAKPRSKRAKNEIDLTSQIKASASKNLAFLQKLITTHNRESNDYRAKMYLRTSVERIFDEVAKPLGLDSDDYLYIAKMTPRFLDVDTPQNADLFDSIWALYEEATDTETAHLEVYHKIIEQLVNYTATHSTGGGTTAEERRNFKKLNRRFKAQEDQLKSQQTSQQSHEEHIKQIADEMTTYQQNRSYSNQSKLDKLRTQGLIKEYLTTQFLTEKTDQASFNKLYDSYDIFSKIADIIEQHPHVNNLDVENMNTQLQTMITEMIDSVLNMLSTEADDRQTKNVRIELKKYARPTNSRELANHFNDALKITKFKGRRITDLNKNHIIMDVQGKNGVIGAIQFRNNRINMDNLPELTEEQQTAFDEALLIMKPITDRLNNEDN